MIKTPFSPACEADIIEMNDLEQAILKHYEELYEFYLNNGEMPYGVAKARDGDPVNWIGERLCEDYGL